MKKLITAIAIGAFAFVGTATTSEARPYGGRGYSAPANTIYVSGYRYGRPVYTEKIFVGYDCYGRPKFTYRTVSAPHRGGYGGGYGGGQCAPAPSHHGYQGYSGYNGYNGYNGRSGGSVSFTFRR